MPKNAKSRKPKTSKKTCCTSCRGGGQCSVKKFKGKKNCKTCPARKSGHTGRGKSIIIRNALSAASGGGGGGVAPPPPVIHLYRGNDQVFAGVPVDSGDGGSGMVIPKRTILPFRDPAPVDTGTDPFLPLRSDPLNDPRHGPAPIFQTQEQRAESSQFYPEGRSQTSQSSQTQTFDRIDGALRDYFSNRQQPVPSTPDRPSRQYQGPRASRVVKRVTSHGEDRLPLSKQVSAVLPFESPAEGNDLQSLQTFRPRKNLVNKSMSTLTMTPSRVDQMLGTVNRTKQTLNQTAPIRPLFGTPTPYSSVQPDPSLRSVRFQNNNSSDASTVLFHSDDES